MEIPFRVCMVVGIVLLAKSCALLAPPSATKVTLPALDASKTMVAEALVVQTDNILGFKTPVELIGGAGEGAMVGMGDYLEATFSAGEAAISGIAIAPILLPAAAVIGANSAHSKDKVDAAARLPS